MRTHRLFATLAVSLLSVSGRLAAQSPLDPFQWLEEIRSDRSMAWVNSHNEATLADLQRMPVFDSVYRRTLAILNSKARIAYPGIRGNYFYNFWTDEQHPRGLWRRTTPVSYLTGTPRWETMLDIDSLSTAEKTTWAWKGADCLPPAYRKCLLSLSRGGGDAVETREFDATIKRFVPGGFFLPEAKGGASWVDDTTLLVSTDFGDGSMTTSGYPRIVKQWYRGTPLSSAVTVFEGKATDVGAGSGLSLIDGRWVPVISNAVTFFSSEYRIFDHGKLNRLDFPADADFNTVGDRMTLYLRSDWKPVDRTYVQGSLIAISYRAFLAGGRGFDVVFAPDAKRQIEAVTTTKSQLLVKVLNNVRSELWRYRYLAGKWSSIKVPAPVLANVDVGSTSVLSDEFFFTSTSFVQPTTLNYVTAAGAVRAVAHEPVHFNAAGLVVEQFEAVSPDGTHVPYFVVHRASMPLNGVQPTILTAYGGFQISSLPYYDGTGGAAWLERGGVLVLANIRGGGEFGPAWHKAAQKEKKQRSYDDFIAVAQDLITRKITSPAHLGIEGGSNGGLLVGAAFTQRPDLFNAVACEVPLLDMQRYTKMSAGASWIDEYGDPDVPEQWAYISKFSPYQNVLAGKKYPRVLFVTTTSDDRVGPAHARKMTAKMESMGYPVYYFENTEGGHGAGDTPEQQAKMIAVTYGYFLKMLR